MTEREELKKIIIENPEICETLLSLALSLLDNEQRHRREDE